MQTVLSLSDYAILAQGLGPCSRPLLYRFRVVRMRATHAELISTLFYEAPLAGESLAGCAKRVLKTKCQTKAMRALLKRY